MNASERLIKKKGGGKKRCENHRHVSVFFRFKSFRTLSVIFFFHCFGAMNDASWLKFTILMKIFYYSLIIIKS
ncbi:hypothetical protein BDA99DRAFT_516088 [Phascolomyces articulosus]|uniref:Uncharacterized protein n=1 Tax=Phascolomyces articulosus TaxID=60185 RepID=A0AAD5PCE5_9FUNG|nr:hypothetical protein BDA99DRAFT_516088 [Phascolomyces articulosus]